MARVTMWSLGQPVSSMHWSKFILAIDISLQVSLSSWITLFDALKANIGHRVTKSLTLEKAKASSAMA